MKCDCSSLNRVIDLCRMKTQHRRVAKLSYPASLPCFSKCMCRIIDHAEIMALCDLLDPLHIAEISVDMNRNNRTRLIRNQLLNLVHIHCIIFLIDVAKYRCQAISHNRMCRGSKAERGRDDLSLKIKRLNRKLERRVSIHKKLQLRNIQILLKFLFQFLMISAHIRQPSALPDRFEHLDIFLKRWHR